MAQLDMNPQNTYPHLREETVDQTVLLKGQLLHAFRDRVRLPNGALSVREYVKHPGAVLIVPLIFEPDGTVKVVLERQYRHPIGEVLIEFPAGKLDPGETPVECGQRELLEETGYVANEWAVVGKLHPCIGYSDEVIHIHFAKGLRSQGRQLDHEEFLDVFTANASEVLNWCVTGVITDGKTLCACLWLNQWLAGSIQLQWEGVAPSTSPLKR